MTLQLRPLPCFMNTDQWGGIWTAPRSYSFVATRNDQTAVQLTKKFNDWNYSDIGIEQRMPWVSGGRLTTSKSSKRRAWGTITGQLTQLDVNALSQDGGGWGCCSHSPPPLSDFLLVTFFAFLLRLSYGQFTHPLSRYPCIYEKKNQTFLPCKKLGGGIISTRQKLKKKNV